jgi:hypothetical protein
MLNVFQLSGWRSRLEAAPSYMFRILRLSFEGGKPHRHDTEIE